MSPNCLFMINGLGLGNSTRCYAVIEYLVERGVQVDVLTSGNGLAFFGDKRAIHSVTAMDAFFYSGAKGRVSGWRTLSSLARLWRLERHKRRQLEALLGHLRPDLVVTDSEYVLTPLRKRGIPVLALNNSDVVVSEYLDGRAVPRTTWSQFWIIEYMDYLFHRFFCAGVISPAAKRVPPRHPRIHRVGLIVRRDVRQRIPVTRPAFPPWSEVRKLVFMLSGSIFASSIDLDRSDLPFEMHVVGREGPSRGRVHYHGKLMDNTAHLVGADVLVINGGFSAVSEAIALGKPTFVIPVPGHAEQFVNARMVADLGMGYVTDEHSVMDKIAALYHSGRWEGLTPSAPTAGFDGAREAADVIGDFLRERVGHAG
ncbi:MAG: glycosyltransferase family protein [bacterium]